MSNVEIKRMNLGGGREALCLHFFPPVINPKKPGQIIKHEKLELTIYARPKNPSEKAYNKIITEIAEKAMLKRQRDIESGRLIPVSGNYDFLSMYQALALRSTYNLTASFALFKRFANGSCPFKSMDKDFCDKYRRYLLDKTKSGISRSTAAVYYRQFHLVLRQAYEQGTLQEDFAASLSVIQADTENKLTLEDLKALLSVPCQSDTAKRMALFTVLTGIRTGELLELDWKDVRFEDDGRNWTGVMRSHAQRIIPLSQDAVSLLPARHRVGKVFRDVSIASINGSIKLWGQEAGLGKRITLSSFRQIRCDTLQQLSKIGTSLQ